MTQNVLGDMRVLHGLPEVCNGQRLRFAERTQKQRLRNPRLQVNPQVGVIWVLGHVEPLPAINLVPVDIGVPNRRRRETNDILCNRSVGRIQSTALWCGVVWCGLTWCLVRGNYDALGLCPPDGGRSA